MEPCSSRLAETELAADHRRTNRLTRELSGGPNAKRLGRPLERIVRQERYSLTYGATTPAPHLPRSTSPDAWLMPARRLVPAPAKNSIAEQRGAWRLPERRPPQR